MVPADQPPFIVDAVVHPYDLSERNRSPDAWSQLNAVYAAHEMATGPEQPQYQLERDEFFTDFPYEAIAEALFVESPVELAVLHALPNLGFTNGYVTHPDRAAAFRDRYPHRFLLYGTVEAPHPGRAIDELERQVRELGIDGLKLYPAFFYDGDAGGWRLDDPDLATPLLEAARDLGIRHIAVHKALWLPPAPRSAFDVDDLAPALEQFSDINFYMVHAGMAFGEETARLLERFPNFHATLESTFAYILVRPSQFDAVMARLLQAAGSERLLFASGANLMHPRPILEAFLDYELPQEYVDKGVPQLTDQDRRNILGDNVARLHGIHVQHVRHAAAEDEYATRPDRGPWNVIRGSAQEAAS